MNSTKKIIQPYLVEQIFYDLLHVNQELFYKIQNFHHLTEDENLEVVFNFNFLQ